MRAQRFKYFGYTLIHWDLQQSSRELALHCSHPARAIPLDAELAEVLLNWKLQSPYPEPSDWVFASPQEGQTTILARFTFPRSSQASVGSGGYFRRRAGWHTLRHTFGTLMKANGGDIKTIQELLRHSQTKLVKMILLPGKKKAGERASGE